MSDTGGRRAHLSLIQPQGYVHSLALLDPLVHLRQRLLALGVPVSLGKNRLEHGAINYVFGAHLGFAPEWAQEFDCVFMQLEQLGTDGAAVSPAYLRLLTENRVVDYHRENVSSYRTDLASVPLWSMGYLPPPSDAPPPLPLEERPLDLLFIGSLTPRRLEIIDQIQTSGVRVAVPERPVYGAERDSLVRNAKAVLNLSAYPTARFEQVRASLVLSLGTPMVSDRRALFDGDRQYAEVVEWFDVERCGAFFEQRFGSPGFFDDARAALSRFAQTDSSACVESMWAVHSRIPARSVEVAPLTDLRVAIGLPAGGYLPGWLNIGTDERAHPDLLVSAYDELSIPSVVSTRRWGSRSLAPACASIVRLGHATTALPDLGSRLTLALDLLREGGRAVLEWPRDAELTTIEEHTDQFWLSGDLHHRFVVERTDALDTDGRPTDAASADRWRFLLRKTSTGIYDATVARAAVEDLEQLMPR